LHLSHGFAFDRSDMFRHLCGRPFWRDGKSFGRLGFSGEDCW